MRAFVQLVYEFQQAKAFVPYGFVLIRVRVPASSDLEGMKPKVATSTQLVLCSSISLQELRTAHFSGPLISSLMSEMPCSVFTLRELLDEAFEETNMARY